MAFKIKILEDVIKSDFVTVRSNAILLKLFFVVVLEKMIELDLNIFCIYALSQWRIKQYVKMYTVAIT